MLSVEFLISVLLVKLRWQLILGGGLPVFVVLVMMSSISYECSLDYEYDPVGDDGRRESVGPEVEERSYTADEQRRFLLELQELGYSSRLPSQLVDGISIYWRRRFEGYLAHSALDESRLGFPLASHILEYCQTIERPFPNRARGDLRIPAIRRMDIESKLTPCTGITPEGLNFHRPLLNYPFPVRFDLVRGAKIHADEGKQREKRAHIDEHIQDNAILPLIGGLTPFLQEVDVMPRVGRPSEELGRPAEGKRS